MGPCTKANLNLIADLRAGTGNHRVLAVTGQVSSLVAPVEEATLGKVGCYGLFPHFLTRLYHTIECLLFSATSHIALQLPSPSRYLLNIQLARLFGDPSLKFWKRYQKSNKLLHLPPPISQAQQAVSSTSHNAYQLV